MPLVTSFASAGRIIIRPGMDAHMGKLFDGLMSGAILANSNGVVSEHVNHRELHQGAQAQGAPHVIDEDEKSRAEGPDFHQAHSVQDRAHGVFTDSEMEIASGIVLRREIAGALLA